MADLAQIRREHVLRAVRELTADVTPGEAPHRLLRGGQEYDATVVVDIAHEHATGWGIQELPGDPDEVPDARDCALLLRGLGFEVTGDGLPPLRFTRAATVGAEHSHATWALAARERLVEVAGVYGDSIDYHGLADFVQLRSLVRTSAHPRTWIGDVLGRVARECARRSEPFLTSLVVDRQGKVGASYATALEAIRGVTPDDVDAQAAEERLDCHRHFGAELPADGGQPVVLRPLPAPRPTPRAGGRAATGSPATRVSTGRSSTPATRASRAAPRRTKAGGARRTAEESVAATASSSTRTCPVHFTVLPPSGVCDYCD